MGGGLVMVRIPGVRNFYLLTEIDSVLLSIGGTSALMDLIISLLRRC